jgi:hypothetical protein
MSPPEHLSKGRPSNVAELAVEVRLAEREAALTEVCYALQLEAMVSSRYRGKLEEIAARIGLSADSTRIVLDEWQYRARLLDEAHVLLRALIPHEKHIRELIAPVEKAA